MNHSQSFELAVREQTDHRQGKQWYVVQELETGEEIIDVDYRAEAEYRMLKMINNQPDKYFTRQDFTNEARIFSQRMFLN